MGCLPARREGQERRHDADNVHLLDPDGCYSGDMIAEIRRDAVELLERSSLTGVTLVEPLCSAGVPAIFDAPAWVFAAARRPEREREVAPEARLLLVGVPVLAVGDVPPRQTRYYFSIFQISGLGIFQ